MAEDVGVQVGCNVLVMFYIIYQSVNIVIQSFQLLYLY